MADDKTLSDNEATVFVAGNVYLWCARGSQERLEPGLENRRRRHSNAALDGLWWDEGVLQRHAIADAMGASRDGAAWVHWWTRFVSAHQPLAVICG